MIGLLTLTIVIHASSSTPSSLFSVPRFELGTMLGRGPADAIIVRQVIDRGRVRRVDWCAPGIFQIRVNGHGIIQNQGPRAVLWEKDTRRRSFPVGRDSTTIRAGPRRNGIASTRGFGRKDIDLRVRAIGRPIRRLDRLVIVERRRRRVLFGAACWSRRKPSTAWQVGAGACAVVSFSLHPNGAGNPLV